MNEKIYKACEIIIKVCSIAVSIAQVVKAAFPVSDKKEITQDQAQLIKDFLQHEELMK